MAAQVHVTVAPDHGVFDAERAAQWLREDADSVDPVMIEKRRAQAKFARERRTEAREPAAFTEEHFPELSRRIGQGIKEFSAVSQREHEAEKRATSAAEDVSLLEEGEFDGLICAILK